MSARSGESSQPAEPSRGIPWFTFFFLTAVFYISQHEWRFPVMVDETYSFTVDQLSSITDNGNFLRQIVFTLLGVFAVGLLLRARPGRFDVGGILGWQILFFVAWSFLSISWSQDTMLSLRRLVLLAMNCLGALAVSRRFSVRDTMLWVFFSTFAYLHIGIATELVHGAFHPLSAGYRFAGTVHPNAQGVNCALFFLASFFLLRSGRSRVFYAAATCEALLFLLLTRSRTSLFFALFTLFICWFSALPSLRRGAVCLAAVFAAGSLLLCADYLSSSLFDAFLLGRDDSEAVTLTGRVPLWGQALSFVAQHPVVGYGYDCFWNSQHIEEFSKEQGWTIPNAHSMYVDCMLSTGIVGGTAMTLILLNGIGRALAARRASGEQGYAFLAAVLAFGALNGLLESGMLQPSHINFATLLALTFLGFPGPQTVAERERSSSVLRRPGWAAVSTERELLR